MPESSNHSLLPGNEGNFGGNQLPDGSIRLSPLRRRRTICPSTSKRAFARVSPDFAFFRHISRFFRVFTLYALTQTTRKITVYCRCVRVCVRVHMCACARVEKHLWCMGVCISVVLRSAKIRKNTGNVVENFKTKAPFLARSCHPRTQKWSKNDLFSPTHCFYTFPGICRRFRQKVLSQTPKKRLFWPEVLFQRS